MIRESLCAIALAASLWAQGQEQVLVAVVGGNSVTFSVAPLTGEAGERGAVAFLEVPGVREVFAAVGDRFQHLWFHRAVPGGRDVMAMLMEQLGDSRRVRVDIVETPDGEVALAELDAGQDLKARSIHDAIAAILSQAGLTSKASEPLPGTTMTEWNAAGQAHWVGSRGRQVFIGRGAFALALGAPRAIRPGWHFDYHLELPDEAFSSTHFALFDLARGAPAEGSFQFDARGYEMRLRFPRAGGEPFAGLPFEKAPRVPPMEGMLIAGRMGLDLARTVESADYELGIDTNRRDAIDMVDGTCSFCVLSPRPGSLIPRMVVGVGLKTDAAALTQLRTSIHAHPRVNKVAGRAAIPIEHDRIPAIVRPWLALDGQNLVMADSVSTLREFLGALDAGSSTVFADESTAPFAIPSAAKPLFEAWFDAGRIWTDAAKVWGKPAGNLIQAAFLMGTLQPMPALLERADLPDSLEVASTLGHGNTIAYWDDKDFVVHTRAPVMGPVWALVGGFMIELMPDMVSGLLEGGRQGSNVSGSLWRAERLGDALNKFKAQHGRLPDRVDELRPLLEPGDAEPLLASHAAGLDEATLQQVRETSWVRAPSGVTAATATEFPRRNAAPPNGPAAPIWAYCGYPYAQHHLVITEGGKAGWTPSSSFLDALNRANR